MTALVRGFPERYPSIHLRVTPTCSSWLNQIELWFAEFKRDVIAGGEFTSAVDLKGRLLHLMRHCNKASSRRGALLPHQSV